MTSSDLICARSIRKIRCNSQNTIFLLKVSSSVLAAHMCQEGKGTGDGEWARAVRVICIVQFRLGVADPLLLMLALIYTR